MIIDSRTQEYFLVEYDGHSWFGFGSTKKYCESTASNIMEDKEAYFSSFGQINWLKTYWLAKYGAEVEM